MSNTSQLATGQLSLLEQLPAETPQSIFECCERSTWNPRTSEEQQAASPKLDLYNLTLVSRIIRASAERQLYKSFYQLSANQAIKFLRSILLRPELGRFVRNCHVYLYGNKLKPNAEELYSLGEEHDQIITTNLSKALGLLDGQGEDEFGNKWWKKLNDGRVDAVIAAILMQCPQLRDLKIWSVVSSFSPDSYCGDFMRYCTLTSAVLKVITSRDQVPASTPLGFVSAEMLEKRMPLTEVSFRPLMSSAHGKMYLDGLSERALDVLFAPSTVTRLKLEIFDLKCETRHSFPGITSLKLHLFEMNLDEEIADLINFVSSFENLEHFHFSQLLDLDTIREFRPLDKIVKSLERDKHCLQSISITTANEGHAATYHLGLDNGQSFNQFVKLTHLDIVAFDNWMKPTTDYSTANIFNKIASHEYKYMEIYAPPGQDTLPPLLQHLVLRQATEITLEHIHDLLVAIKEDRVRDKRQILPHLRYIRVEMTETLTYGSRSVSKLKRIVEVTGLIAHWGKTAKSKHLYVVVAT